MRLLWIVICAFLMRVNSSDIEPIQTTDVGDLKATTVSETNTEIVFTTAVDKEVTTTQKSTETSTEQTTETTTEQTTKQTTEQTTEQTTKISKPMIPPSVLINELINQDAVVTTTTKKSKRSPDSAPLNSYTSHVARETPIHVERPLSFVKPFGYNGQTSGCSCYCPPSAPPPPCQAPYHPTNYAPEGGNNVPPNVHHKFRAAEGAEDEDEIEDSVPHEARSQSAYAQEPSYSNAYPPQSYAPQPAYVEPVKPTYAQPPHYAAPAPSYHAPSYTYPSPAPQVSCGQNLLAGCAPTVAEVPCSGGQYSY